MAGTCSYTAYRARAYTLSWPCGARRSRARRSGCTSRRRGARGRVRRDGRRDTKGDGGGAGALRARPPRSVRQRARLRVAAAGVLGVRAPRPQRRRAARDAERPRRRADRGRVHRADRRRLHAVAHAGHTARTKASPAAVRVGPGAPHAPSCSVEQVRVAVRGEPCYFTLTARDAWATRAAAAATPSRAPPPAAHRPAAAAALPPRSGRRHGGGVVHAGGQRRAPDRLLPRRRPGAGERLRGGGRIEF